jgi:molybdate transport system substrate-binding protein
MLARLGTLVAWVVALAMAAPCPAGAAETQVAVAANFAEPARAIAAAFTKATGHTANLSFGSSGQFYSQIVRGAPFDVFLSADAERPAKAEAEGYAVPSTRFTYAVGRLVLYSKTPGLASAITLKTQRFDKLAIADPTAAPYGQAAVETLRKLGVYEAVKPKIVQGASIAQAYQFVSTGAAELGFVALSQVVGEPQNLRWTVPAENHAPIVQQAVLLKTGASNPAATAFLNFLKSPNAIGIIKRYGYEVK